MLVRAAVVAVLPLLALTAACGGDDDEAPSGAAGSDGPTVEQVLSRSADAIAALASFHFLLTHQNGSTPIVFDLRLTKAEGDVLAPDRLQAKLDAERGPFSVDVDVITIGTDLWVTDPLLGRWQKVGQGIDIRDIFAPDRGVPELLRSARDGRFDGDDRIDGVPSHRIKVTVDGGALRAIAPIAREGQNVPVTLWIGKEDVLVRRIDIEGPLTDREKSDIRRRLQLSRFDQPLTISPP
jgi:lipoprotein LprG